MRINASYINFSSTTRTYYRGNISIEEILNDNDIMTKYSEYDTVNKRPLLTNTYSDIGEILSEQKFDYFENGFTENYKSQTQEYTRTVTNQIKENLKHRIEKYVSKTNPSQNYIHETIHDFSNKLLQFLCNGKKIL